MPNIPRRGSRKPWMAKRKNTFKGNEGEDAHFYNSRPWRKLRKYILQGEPLCRSCSEVATVVDHITPIRLGGSRWNHENLQPLCARCHNKKSSSERSNTGGYTNL